MCGGKHQEPQADLDTKCGPDVACPGAARTESRAGHQPVEQRQHGREQHQPGAEQHELTQAPTHRLVGPAALGCSAHGRPPHEQAEGHCSCRQGGANQSEPARQRAEERRGCERRRRGAHRWRRSAEVSGDPDPKGGAALRDMTVLRRAHAPERGVAPLAERWQLQYAVVWGFGAHRLRRSKQRVGCVEQLHPAEGRVEALGELQVERRGRDVERRAGGRARARERGVLLETRWVRSL